MRPPLVYSLVPFQTWRMLPVCIFLVTRLALLALRATRVDLRATRFATLGLVALRTTRFGALGLDALRAARRVDRRAVRLAFLGLEADRTTAFTAMVGF